MTEKLKDDYQCVLIGEAWHMTQEQANPPKINVGGAWTTCSTWAEFKRGFDKRRPTCKICLEACVYDETYSTYGNRGTLPEVPKQQAPESKPVEHDRPASPEEESPGASEAGSVLRSE